MRFYPLLKPPPDYLEVDRVGGWLEVLPCLPKVDPGFTPGAPSLLGAFLVLARVLGIELHPAQAYIVRCMSELDPVSGDLVFREFGISVPRQVGKTTLLLLAMLRVVLAVPNAVLLYAAQSGGASKLKLKTDIWPLLEGSVLVERFGLKKNLGSPPMVEVGENYSFVLFWPGSDSAVHGASLDGGILDEAWEHEDDTAEQAIMNTLMPGSQYLIVSTHGTLRSVFFNRKRRRALELLEAGEHRVKGFGWVEWGAPDDVSNEDALRLETVRAANPAVDWVPGALERVERAMVSMDVYGFKRAQLNITVPERGEPLIPQSAWEACQVDPELWVREDGWLEGACLGLDASPLARRASAVVCSASGRVEVVGRFTGDDEDLILEWMLEQIGSFPATGGVALRVPGPLAGFAERFESEGVEVHGYNQQEWQSACFWTREMTVARNLRFRFDPVLTTGQAYAGRSPKSGDVWRWDAPIDIPDLDLTALNAGSGAIHRATGVPAEEVPVFRSWLLA